MMRSPSVCRERGCLQKVEAGSHWCAQHQQADQRVNNRVRDDVDKRYGREPWPSFRLSMLNFNPICQRILKDGEQCHEPARIVHHLMSPRVRPDLFVDPKNVACLCAGCHPPDEGTPWWTEGKEYVATQFRLPSLSQIPGSVGG
jgi:hypothetical protein